MADIVDKIAEVIQIGFAEKLPKYLIGEIKAFEPEFTWNKYDYYTLDFTDKDMTLGADKEYIIFEFSLKGWKGNKYEIVTESLALYLEFPRSVQEYLSKKTTEQTSAVVNQGFAKACKELGSSFDREPLIFSERDINFHSIGKISKTWEKTLRTMIEDFYITVAQDGIDVPLKTIYMTINRAQLKYDEESRKLLVGIDVQYYKKDAESLSGYVSIGEYRYRKDVVTEIFPSLTEKECSVLQNRMVQYIREYTNKNRQYAVSGVGYRFLRDEDRYSWIMGEHLKEKKEVFEERITVLYQKLKEVGMDVSEVSKSPILLKVCFPNNKSSLLIGSGGLMAKVDDTGGQKVLYANKLVRKGVENSNTLKKGMDNMTKVYGRNMTVLMIMNIYDLRIKKVGE